MSSPCVLSALALASLPLPTFCNHVHKVSCHERARACIVTQLSCKNPASPHASAAPRLCDAPSAYSLTPTFQESARKAHQFKRESTKKRAARRKPARLARLAPQSIRLNLDLHAGTHLSALLDRGAGCRSRWYMNHSGWLTGDNASRLEQPEIAIDDCRGSIGGAMRELAGGGD